MRMGAWGEVSWVMERGEEKLTAEDVKRMRQNKEKRGSAHARGKNIPTRVNPS